MSPKEFDEQSVVPIDRWIDLNGEECRRMDDNLSLTKKYIKAGVEGKVISFDSLGRIWLYSEKNKIYYPMHFEYKKLLIGYKISAKAAN